MGMRIRRDLLIAALCAAAIHAGAACVIIHSKSVPLPKNKLQRTLEISLVSTYKEEQKIQPVVQKKERQVIIKRETALKKKRPVLRKKPPVEPRVRQVEQTVPKPEPEETVTTAKKVVVPPVKEVVREVHEISEPLTGDEQTDDLLRVEETVEIAEEYKDPEPEPVRRVEILPAVPRYKENPPPRYPPVARRRGYEGKVMLFVEVLIDGTVGDLKVRETSGHSMLDRAAVRTVRKWKFEPALREGRPLSMWVEVPIRFVIE